jgi:YlmC/YmxH family sporulation protein
MGGIIMNCSLEKIRSKEVIDVLTGERLGYVDDISFNPDTSEVISLVIYGRERLFGLLGREENIVIKCSEIQVIGNDVMLIRRTKQEILSESTNNRRFFQKRL